MEKKKEPWKKPQLIVLAQETTEEISLVGCKLFTSTKVSVKTFKKGCKRASCKVNAKS